jgi:hypothetical protein
MMRNKVHTGVYRSMLVISWGVVTSPLFAQHGNHEVLKQTKADTNTLAYKLRKGNFDAHFRLYYMTTQNEGALTDYYAWAFGGGVRYETGSYKGLQLGVGGFFTWNMASSDLAKPDSLTGAKSRYEIGQFDMEDPENRNDLDRLEHFYIRYSHKNWQLTYGKQVIQSPFINPQDGRMRPTGEDGLWGSWKPDERWKMEGGWLRRISPRGTVRWFNVDESIGIYPTGSNVYGEKSQYKGNLESNGVGIVGIHFWPGKKIHFQFWEHYVDGIFNTVFFQGDLNLPVGQRGLQWISGAQYTFQNAVSDGGNNDPHKAYFHPANRSQVFGLRTGLRSGHRQILLNATRITADGRFLMPREWGREPFYTFIPRERNEGAGDVKAFSLNLSQAFPKMGIRAAFNYGYYDMPDLRDARLNKYLFPSYHHFLVDLQYQFKGFMQGLNIQGIYVYKRDAGNTYEDPRSIIHKVNMHHVNLILNYMF